MGVTHSIIQDIIQGIQPGWNDDLGMTGRRDPDALPPSNAFQHVMHWVYVLTSGLTRGNALFAIKAGLLTGKHVQCFMRVSWLTRAQSYFAYLTS